MLGELFLAISAVAALPLSSQVPSNSGFTSASIHPSRGGNAICMSAIIPITTSATNFKLNFALPLNQSQVTGTFVDFFAAGSTVPQQTITGIQNVSATYNIGVSICSPANGAIGSTVQILTHGVGFDRYYWDFAADYSYVDYAAQHGYTTVTYDRLGVGKSAKADPLSDVQSPLEIAILAQLIQRLRTGAIGGKAFERVIGVGHSYGSILTQGITNTYPQLLDAAVLTGFSIDSSGSPSFIAANNFAIASQNSPYRFAGLSNGYLVASSAISSQYAFLKAPNFDPEILATADAQKGTFALGELFTLTIPIRQANFTGPVAVVNGVNDLPFCNGNCTAKGMDQTSITRTALFPTARNVTGSPSTFNVPLTGHGINLHYSAGTAYQFIHNFIKAAGY